MKTILIIIGETLVILSISMGILLIGNSIIRKSTHNIIKEKQELKLKYSILQEENDMLYDYIENIDTFKTLDDAIEASQDLIDQIQMLYE